MGILCRTTNIHGAALGVITCIERALALELALNDCAVSQKHTQSSTVFRPMRLPLNCLAWWLLTLQVSIFKVLHCSLIGPLSQHIDVCRVTCSYQPYNTANVTKTTAQGGFKVIIQHAPLPNVTSEQIKWFFTNLGGHTKWDGEYVRNYLLM